MGLTVNDGKTKNMLSTRTDMWRFDFQITGLFLLAPALPANVELLLPIGVTIISVGN